MNEDIKEILEQLKSAISNPKCIDREKAQRYYNSITNLQEKVKQYENPDDMTLFYMWLDEKAKDKIKQLQEEVNKLTAESTDWESKCYKLQDTLKDREEYITHLEELSNKYEEEHSTTFEEWKKEIEKYQLELEKADSITQSCIFQGKQESEISFRNCLNKMTDYKTRIDTAIEYIEKHYWGVDGFGDIEEVKKILSGNILQGSDKE